MIRPAKLADLVDLIKIEEACFTTDLISARQFRYLIQSPTAIVNVIEYEKIIAGYAVVLFRKNQTLARLYSIAISPTFQSQGLASRLCDEMESQARSKFCDEIGLEVKQSAHAVIAFYAKRGYQVRDIRPGYYEDGEDALRMKKKLTTRKIDKD